MDADGDAESDVERVGQGGEHEAAVAGVEGDETGGHGEGDGGVGGRPTPENPAFEQAQLETVAAINEGTFVGGGHTEAFERRREAAGEGFVEAGYSIAKQGGLAQGPGGGEEVPVFFSEANEQEEQGSEDGQEAADDDGGAGEAGEQFVPGGEIVRPVEAGLDDKESEANGQGVPPEVAPAKRGENILGQPV